MTRGTLPNDYFVLHEIAMCDQQKLFRDFWYVIPRPKNTYEATNAVKKITQLENKVKKNENLIRDTSA